MASDPKYKAGLWDRHLTHRALETLASGGRKPYGGYRADVGHPACEEVTKGPSRSLDWCTVADVRAMARGWEGAYELGKEKRLIERPTCPRCCVLLDEALEKFVLAPPRWGRVG